MGRRIIHGFHDHYLYNTWKNMMERCYNVKCKFYPNYGGRGIKVFEPWKKVDRFIPDIIRILGDRPKGYSIDRKNNLMGYYPGNLRWSSLSEQSRNREVVSKYTWNGETKSLIEWSEQLNLKHSTIRARLSRGWNFEKAITFPISKSNGGFLRSRDPDNT